MCTSSFIKRHILELPKGMIFSTREMLNYGRRSAVDQCLYRLVKMGRIVRLAWGIFMKDDADIATPTPMSVANEKAKAFGRYLVKETLGATQLRTLTDHRTKTISYAIQGHSSSFKYGAITIQFRGTCARKMLLAEDAVGMAIKTLWRLGVDACDHEALAKATAEFTRQERLQFKRSCHLMPEWITNLFKK